MAARLLPVEALALRCDPGSLDLDFPMAPHGLTPGQQRARDAIDFALAMQHPGYHLFVTGAPGTGRRTLVRTIIEAHIARGGRPPRSDWVYVHHFDQPERPLALQLPAGRGTALRADLRALVESLRSMIPAAFESEEHATQAERINQEFKEQADRGLAEVAEAAQQEGMLMLRLPAGFSFVPTKDGKVMSTEDFEALPAEEHARLQQVMHRLQERLVHTLRASMRQRKEHADRLRALHRATTQLAVDHAMVELRARWADLAAVCRHLDAVQAAVIDNADAFRSDDEAAAAALAPYEVNLLIDAGSNGVPVVEADLPTHRNLLGRVDHVAHMGTLITDFRHIQPGLLHQANGGYLLIDALKLLGQPMAWDSLKRALLRNEVRIEALAELFGLLSTVQLEPQPVPLQVKVVLFGERVIWDLLQAYDPDFLMLFRVVADLDDDLPRTPEIQRSLAQALLVRSRELELLPPDRAALARMLDHGARCSGDATRVSARIGTLVDLLHEADHLARGACATHIDAAHVEAAICARRTRAGRIDARLREAVMRGHITIQTAGSAVGQVNGLAAYEVGDEAFGMPMRITATTRFGEGQVVDIQRESSMSGPLHARGVLILSSFLAARYARFQPYSITGSLVFEQTYGRVEGDSASLGELVALLSSLADAPVRQCLALTGSVDQYGLVQAIGAVNEKIEGFFDLCVQHGLDGTHGVLIPQANASQLMLREEVVEAVRSGRFTVRTVQTVDEALETLTGLPAGDLSDPSGDSVNGRVARRLDEYARLRRGEPRLLRSKAGRGRFVIERMGR